MSNFQQKNHKAYKEIGKYGPFKGRKNNPQKLSEKDLIMDLVDKAIPLGFWIIYLFYWFSFPYGIKKKKKG